MPRGLASWSFTVPPERKNEIEQVCKVVMSILQHRFHVPEKDLHEYSVYGVPKGDRQKIEESIINLAIQDKWGLHL